MSSYPWLSTDNQTDQKPGYGGQHGFINFNLYALKLGGFRGLIVCWHCPFSYVSENEAVAAMFS